jgi:dihydrofolate reductase
MGRKTYEDILSYAKDKNDPLPGRKLVILTSNYDSVINYNKNIIKIPNMDYLCNIEGMLCFIGGVNVYAEASRRYENLLLSVTRLNFQNNVECDKFFKPEDFNFRLFKRIRLDNTIHFIELYTNSKHL